MPITHTDRKNKTTTTYNFRERQIKEEEKKTRKISNEQTNGKSVCNLICVVLLF